MKTKKTGFTLAEVLITLGVIGVVAAMTIPTLINNYQKTEYATKLKKSYSLSSQVLQQLSADMGCTGDLACTGLFGVDSNNNTLGSEFVKYFNVAKDCKTAPGCWADRIIAHYDGSVPAQYVSVDIYGSYNFITQDGVSFSISKFDSGNCSSYNGGKLNKTCGSLIIDVNGLKGPNFSGRDVFRYSIANDKGPLLSPLGGVDSISTWKSAGCGFAGETNGEYCAGRIMEEGWQMNY